MPPTLRLAVSQFPVTGDIAANACYITQHMRKAAHAQAHVVHFPEAALSGYACADFASFNGYDWHTLDQHTHQICALAAALGLWVVLGSARTMAPHQKPRNCLHVISPVGAVAGSYDKQRLYGKEHHVYSAGHTPLLLTINGMTCGFLICYDSCFPDLYHVYRERGARLLFHSYYNARYTGPSTSLDDLMLAQLRTRAADNHLWISASNSSARHSRLASCVARPDGSLRSTKRHVPGVVLHDFPDPHLGWTYDNSKIACGRSSHRHHGQRRGSRPNRPRMEP
jgi:predicted amidohydrolase